MSHHNDEYSSRWLARYGQTLMQSEIRLVQAYRGLEAQQREGLLLLASNTVMHNARVASDRRAAQRAAHRRAR
jgi:hypothetical protein